MKVRECFDYLSSSFELLWFVPWRLIFKTKAAWLVVMWNFFLRLFIYFFAAILLNVSWLCSSGFTAWCSVSVSEQLSFTSEYSAHGMPCGQGCPWAVETRRCHYAAYLFWVECTNCGWSFELLHGHITSLNLAIWQDDMSMSLGSKNLVWQIVSSMALDKISFPS